MIERLKTPAFAQDQNVGMPLCDEKRGARRALGHDRIDRVRCSVNEGRAARKQASAIHSARGGRHVESGENAEDRLGRKGGSLKDREAPVVVFDDEIGECAAGVRGEAHCGLRISRPTSRDRRTASSP